VLAAISGHGAPHGVPIEVSADANGTRHWLAFVGTDEVALGAWWVAVAPDGSTKVDPVGPLPTGTRVIGGVARRGVAYVLLESLNVLDQPGGLHGVWILHRPGHWNVSQQFPLALAGVSDTADLGARIDAFPAPAASPERSAGTLLATLQAAGASTEALTHELSAEGADLEMAWQTMFARKVGHLEPGASPDRDTGERALGLVRDVLPTQACGLDACQAWTSHGKAIVRFTSSDDRWTIRALIEDAPAARVAAGRVAARVVDASADTEATTLLLATRSEKVRQLLGQAPLQVEGGTIGIGLTDNSPDSPWLAVREGLAGRIFSLDLGSVRSQVQDATWEASFADVNGDGRTDVALRMNGARADGTPLAWTQVFLAPAPSVQAATVEADLASALAVMDAPDAKAAARAAVIASPHPVTHEEACQLLASATTLPGFRKAAAPGARLLLFQEPGRPTWRPKIVPLAKIAAGDVHGFAAHCGEMTCDTTRPYCSYQVPGDSLHVWFAWEGPRLEIAGVADYSGE
jgi:hypothetical protein